MITIEDFSALDALERVRAVDREFGDKALQLSSMQKTSSVLLHMIHRLKAKTVILFVDTQYHFPETLALRDEFEARYGLRIRTVTPEKTPEQQERKFQRELWKYVDGQPQCCELRKEKPFLKAAKGMSVKAVLNGLMRAEGGKRANMAPIENDPRIWADNYYPLFDWTEEQVEAYVAEHDVPVHALHAKSYPSIGCATCTTPVAPGEDRRAGRWRHLRDEDGNQPEYCGINFTDMGGGI